MDKNIMKLSDDDLEMVSGGTTEESNDVARAMGFDGFQHDSLLHFLRNYGINAELSDSGSNCYYDSSTGYSLSQDDVIQRIHEGMREY
jgi:hypothetical protein